MKPIVNNVHYAYICLFHVSYHVDHFKARFFDFLKFENYLLGDSPTPIGKFQLGKG